MEIGTWQSYLIIVSLDVFKSINFDTPNKEAESNLSESQYVKVKELATNYTLYHLSPISMIMHRTHPPIFCLFYWIP